MRNRTLEHESNNRAMILLISPTMPESSATIPSAAPRHWIGSFSQFGRATSAGDMMQNEPVGGYAHTAYCAEMAWKPFVVRDIKWR